MSDALMSTLVILCNWDKVESDMTAKFSVKTFCVNLSCWRIYCSIYWLIIYHFAALYVLFCRWFGFSFGKFKEPSQANMSEDVHADREVLMEVTNTYEVVQGVFVTLYLVPVFYVDLWFFTHQAEQNSLIWLLFLPVIRIAFHAELLLSIHLPVTWWCCVRTNEQCKLGSQNHHHWIAQWLCLIRFSQKLDRVYPEWGH